MTLFCGKQPATKPRFTLYSELRPLLVKDPKVTLPQFPANFGHAGVFSGNKWLMLGNGPDDTVFPGFQGCGDCAWADPAHSIMESARTSGRPVPPFSGKTVVAQYSAYSGYNPQTGANDNGSNVQDVLQWRQTKGIYDDTGAVHKIGQAVSLTPGNLQEAWECSFLFERVTLGVVMTQAQEDQFADHKAWSHVPGSPEIGGHDIPLMSKLDVVSWAEEVGVTQSFLINQMDEGHAYIDPELYNKVTGKTAEGFTDQDLEKYIVLAARIAFAA